MSRILANAVQSREVRLPERIGPRGPKATLKSPTASDARTQADLFDRGPAIWDVLVHGAGSVKALAADMEKDESLARRQVQDGTLKIRELFTIDEAALCDFAEYVLDTFKPARKSPRERALEKLADMQKQIVDLQLALQLEDE